MTGYLTCSIVYTRNKKITRRIAQKKSLKSDILINVDNTMRRHILIQNVILNLDGKKIRKLVGS